MIRQELTVILLVAACFVAGVLNLAVNSSFRRKTSRAALLAVFCIGSALYGYGFAWKEGLSTLAVVRALMALCRMFAGINDLGSIQDAPWFQHKAVLTIFWLGHFLAFYITASTVIASLGERLLRRIRATLLRKGPLLLIYGVNPDSLSYGRYMARQKHRSVFFVDQECSAAYESELNSFGAVLDKEGETPSARFLRQINMKPGSRRLELAALHADGRKNLAYAQSFLQVLTECGIGPEQTSLLVRGAGEDAYALQALESEGYGSVLAFDDYELVARMVVREHPPCDLIGFDGRGKALEDFNAVILGFGRMGRAILTQLIQNGQFCGSRFQADIFDPGPQNGFLHDHALMRQYAINFHPVDGKSDEFYAFLEENRKKIDCIVLCTGSKDDNREIADDLGEWFRGNGRAPMIIQVSRDGFLCMDQDRRETQRANLYGSGMLDVGRMDALAMQINHVYHANSSRSAPEDWKRCDYFSRMSCRASADFYPAVLRACGKTAEQVLGGDWPPDAETLENLAVTEHMRWCAFHYVMGFLPMSAKDHAERAVQYRRQMEQSGSPSLSVSKDMKRRLHACLVPWDELDALSARENELSGRSVNYKQMDRDNVLAVKQILSALKEAEETDHE